MIKDIIYEDSTIKASMLRVQQTSRRCLVVSNKKKILLGTLSDGDIRRALLKGYKTNHSIKSIYNKKSFYINEKDLNKYVFRKKNNYELLIPVVDNDKRLKKIIYKDEILNVEKKSNFKKIPVVIMAGGQGTRMAPFTKVLPKPLLPIKNTTVIENILSNFKKNGFNKFFISINFKEKLLKTYLDEIKLNSKNFEYIEEKKPLGTAGSLFFLKRKIKSNFFLCNCDTLINANYSAIYDFHLENKFDITLIAAMKNISIPYGVCQMDKDQGLLRINEKPNKHFIVSTGSYVFSKNIFKLLNKKNKRIQMNDLINNARKIGLKMGIYPIEPHLWQDTGNWQNYQKTIGKNLLEQ